HWIDLRWCGHRAADRLDDRRHPQRADGAAQPDRSHPVVRCDRSGHPGVLLALGLAHRDGATRETRTRLDRVRYRWVRGGPRSAPDPPTHPPDWITLKKLLWRPSSVCSW